MMVFSNLVQRWCNFVVFTRRALALARAGDGPLWRGIVRSVLRASVVFVMVGCASPDAQWRSLAAEMAAASGWQAHDIDAGAFVLRSYAPAAAGHAGRVSLYIEGDGRAWITDTQPSFDPTPADPVALRMALRHPAGAAGYLARPCQYVETGARRNCAQRYWTSHRFAPEVVDATSRAVDALKRRWAARQVELIGFSGGGALALLVAARRDDVSRVVTVAGNLDHAAWTRELRLTPLFGSLNAADDAVHGLGGTEQVHFSGAQDRTIPRAVADAYFARLPPGARARRVEIPGAGHLCCWAQDWPALYPR